VSRSRDRADVAIPNLFVLETLSSIKVADLLQKNLSSDREAPLNVYLQVNTSGEEAKSGLAPDSDELLELALHVIDQCPGLHLFGLMTIGSWDASHDTSKPNPDFTSLSKTRETLTQKLKDKGHSVERELSMGMSADFAQAVKEGSSSVRVGTRIFGERPKKN
jgi:pyridoxal phosphate enzyme (YggS family)